MEISKGINKEIRIGMASNSSDLQPAKAGKDSVVRGVNNHKINNSLKLAQWNSCGFLDSSKAQTVNSIQCDLIAIQETRRVEEKQLKNIYQKEVLSKRERMESNGGGSLTLSNLNITHKEEYEINEDSSLLRIVIDGVFVIWIGNVYFNRGSKGQIKNLFAVIQKSVPDHERRNMILAGDFNIDLSSKKPELLFLNSLCKQYQLNIQTPGKGTRYQAILDYIICGDGIEAKLEENLKSVSDHNVLIWKILFKATSKPKKILIPNRKLANEITQAAIMDPQVTNSFELIQKFLVLRKLNRKKAFLKIKPKRKNNDNYKNLLLSIKEEESIKEVLNSYWNNFWNEVEEKRFSPLSKEAFDTLRTICKYHLYEKRDGSIVSKIKGDNEQIITESNEVAAQLIEVLKEIQHSKEFTQYTGQLQFPELPRLEARQLKTLLSSLSTGKAVSYDLFSDMILRDEKAMERLTIILQDLWSSKLNNITNINDLFKGRLIALNKVHPNIPKKEEFRPIIILSQIVKIMECRWLPKLQEYCVKSLCPSQTGFVPGQGVFTNIYRTMEKIKEITKRKKSAFGLFIDFKSAYNYARHDLLFERLEKVLGKEEIDFQKAIYDKLIIQLDNSTFKPNLGVAQGSVISPSLFDIYTEPLLLELNQLIPIDNILAYADDILILCEDLDTLIQCMNIVERWSTENNLKINKKKSAILEFVKRRAGKTLLTVGNHLRGYPIVKNYKYLGTLLSQKLELEPQMQFIKKKVNFMKFKLNPMLYNASLELRKNLWQVFVLPLFEFTIPIYSYEEAATKRDKLERLMRNTFKSFTGLKNTVDTKLIEELMGYSLKERSEYLQYTSQKKWESRKNGQIYSIKKDSNRTHAKLTQKTNLCKYFTKEMVKYINMQTALCPKCKERDLTIRCSRDHLEKHHHIKIDSVNNIASHIKRNSQKEVLSDKNKKKKKNKNREEMIQTFKEYFDPNYKKLKMFFSESS